MSSDSTKKSSNVYVTPTKGSKDVKSSPLALLVATCSKIGTVDENNPDAQEQGSQNVRLQVGQNHYITISTDLLHQPGVLQQISSLINVQNSTINIDASGLQQKSLNAQQIQVVQNPSQNHIISMGAPQMIATPVPGPGGTITYNLIPQYQNIMVINPEEQNVTTQGVSHKDSNSQHKNNSSNSGITYLQDGSTIVVDGNQQTTIKPDPNQQPVFKVITLPQQQPQLQQQPQQIFSLQNLTASPAPQNLVLLGANNSTGTISFAPQGPQLQNIILPNGQMAQLLLNGGGSNGLQVLNQQLQMQNMWNSSNIQIQNNNLQTLTDLQGVSQLLVSNLGANAAQMLGSQLLTLSMPANQIQPQIMFTPIQSQNGGIKWTVLKKKKVPTATLR